MSVHGPVPARRLAWKQMSIACVRGKCSSYHVDTGNGLTFTACSKDGFAAAKLEYADGVGKTLGRFWTEIMPQCMHRVVAMAERSALSVYLPPLVPYSALEAKVGGPTQMVIRTSNGRGETQHAWPHNASARFLLSQVLKQLGGEAAYKQVTMKTLDGKQIGMDAIVPKGSTVFVQLDITATNFVLSAGGKWGSQHLSDGEVIKNIRQVRPQLEPQQLLEQVLQEEKRQGMVPKLGLQKEGESGKAQESQAGWQQVSRKGGKKP
eukprot:480834-Amphidinium_carterae.2